MGRKNSPNQLPIDSFRRAIGENQRKRQKDQVSHVKNIADKKIETQDLSALSAFIRLNMEWDEVETSGLFQQFESFAITKFTELRQRHWRECTAAITDVRKMINQLRADFEEGISRVNAEKTELEKELEKCQGMIEGKNLELLGLRRQLRSYNLSKTVCKKCECEVPEAENKLEKEEAEQNSGRKRARFNLSLTSSTDPPGDLPEALQGSDCTVHRRPSEKRLCLATANGHVSVEVSKQKPRDSAVASNVLVPETQQESSANGSPESRTLTNGTVPQNGQNSFEIKPEDGAEQSIRSPMSDPLSRRPFGLSALSPPSQVYDASAAIRRAVNHLDLANYEPSVIVTPQASKQSRSRSGGNKTHLARHLHKKTCRHYQSPPPRVGRTPCRKSRPSLTNDLLSDATGADLTFPSISTLAEATNSKIARGPETSLMPPPPPPDGDMVRVTRRASKQNGTDNFPSLGGSPTAQEDIEIQLVDIQCNPPKRTAKTSNAAKATQPQKNVDQCNDCEEYLRAVGLSPKMIEKRMRNTIRHRHLSPKGRRRSSSFGTTLSTPQNFWSIGNFSPTSPSRRASQKPTRRPELGATLRRLRRRRPLEMPRRN